LGLGEIIEAAKLFANAGTMQKIMKFANEVEEMNGRLERIEVLLRNGNGQDISAEPGSYAPDCGPRLISSGDGERSPESDRSDWRLAVARLACRHAHGDRGGPGRSVQSSERMDT
jgi:hypothetical protein